MVKKNLSELLGMAAKTEIPVQAGHGGGSSKMSFGIVHSLTNGKRISFSKLLAQKLELDKCAYIALAPEAGYILISNRPPFENSIECSFSRAENDGKKISYCSAAVHAITDAFALNFKQHVSVSYDDIEVDKLEDGTPVAMVKVYNKYPDAQ